MVELRQVQPCLDDYGRKLDTALLENYTSINGKTIIMRAMFLERED